MLLLVIFITGNIYKSFAQEGIPNKIKLLVLDVGTIDTVAKTEKFLAPTDKVNMDAPPSPSPADAMADPDLRRRAAHVNWETGMIEYLQTRDDIRRENQQRRKILEALRTSITGSKENRMVVLAKDYLASALSPYADFIDVVDRSEASLSEIEKAIADKAQEEVAPATLFLTVTLGDQKEESTTVPVGNTKVKKTTYTRRAVASVRDFSNVRVCSFDVVAKAGFRQTDAVAMKGHDPSDELIIDLMNQIGKKVGEHFLREYTVKVKIPKALNNEVSSEDFEVYIDRVVKRTKNEEGEWEEEILSEGSPVAIDEPFMALAIDHWITIVAPSEEFSATQSQVKVGRTKKTATFTIRKNKIDE